MFDVDATHHVVLQEAPLSLSETSIGFIIFDLEKLMSDDHTKRLPNEDMRRVLARLDSIDERLKTLEDKVDRRLHETRPIWEQVLVRLENFEGQMRNGFGKLERQVGLLAEDILRVRTDLRYLDERVTRLESGPYDKRMPRWWS